MSKEAPNGGDRRVGGVANTTMPNAEAAPTTLVLASSSPYRRALLGRLGLPFEVADPAIDESPGVAETVQQLVHRLAAAKARAVARQFPDALIIGSDQAASFAGRILGKPGTAAKACAELVEFSGKTVDFFTGLAVLHAPSGRLASHMDHTVARFREFTVGEAARYVERDRPLDCAGAIKFESTGALLLSAVETRDPSAAIGLPLIELGAMLRAEGLNPLAH